MRAIFAFRKRTLSILLREPLLHFMLIGASLFVAGELYRQHSDIYRIAITPQREALLATRYRLQLGTMPDAATLQQLVDQDVHEEILFREGLALKLDQDDEMVRRRIVQKTEFLLQDTHAPAEPTDTDLKHFYDTHRDSYLRPERITFSHIYFSEAQGEDVSRSRAQAALSRVSNAQGRAPELGDAFPDRYDFSAYEPAQITRLFGQTELSNAILVAPVSQWSGPYRSAYGWHLVYVEAHAPPRQLSFDEVRDRVRADWLENAQAKANKAAFDAIARKFTVVHANKK